jgi:DNA-binding transcriptional MerR regulator
MSQAPPDPSYRTVGEVADLAHVSVRTLHHYDEIGLLPPARRTDAGYRLYGPEQLERLHQVLLFRELGLALDDIAGLLDAPAAERARALLTHRRALEDRRRRTDAVLRAVDRAIEMLEEGGTMKDTELFDGFEDFDHAEYAEEAKERWGGTDAYARAQRRTKDYTKADWAAIQAEADDIMKRFVALMESGSSADSDEAAALAEEHRRHISRRYYDCPPMMHVGLAEMYGADARFGEYFEKYADGMTAFVAEAIRANAARG